jgi:hypothetical protein
MLGTGHSVASSAASVELTSLLVPASLAVSVSASIAVAVLSSSEDFITAVYTDPNLYSCSFFLQTISLPIIFVPFSDTVSDFCPVIFSDCRMHQPPSSLVQRAKHGTRSHIPDKLKRVKSGGYLNHWRRLNLF